MKKLLTIVGAGPGISQGVAKRFGREGFKIALVARNEEKLKQLIDELQAEGVEATYAVADVAKADSLQKALTQIRDREGQAEMMLYNASAADVKDLLVQDWDTFKRTFDVNVGGAFHLLKLALPYYLKENKGKLFFTGGGTALAGNPEWTTLGVGKAGLRNLVQAAAKKVEGTNVHIAHLIVCGYVNPEDQKYSPTAIAEEYWKLYLQVPGEFKTEIIY